MNFNFFENETSEWEKYHDEYGLFNYQFLVEELGRIARASKDQGNSGGGGAEEQGDGKAVSLTLALINMDYFKTINSALGNAGGDILLAIVANRIQSVLNGRGKSGRTWRLCRTRADEFALLIEEESDDVEAVLAEVRDAIYKPCNILCAGESRTVYPSASIGVLSKAQGQESAARILEMASEALRASKGAGLGKILFYKEEMENESAGGGAIYPAKVLSRRYEIHEGLKADQAGAHTPELEQFIPYFQPIHYCSTRELAGFETLVRWNHPNPEEHPNRDMSIPLAPVSFIDYAKRSGDASQIDRLMMRKAMDFVQGYPEYSFYFSVNATPNLLECDDVRKLKDHPVVRILDDLKRSDIDTSRCALEVLEDSLDEKKINNVIAVLETLKKDYGIRVFLDDFGTGYSSLGRIPTLPIDCIKLDKSFIDKAVLDENSLLRTLKRDTLLSEADMEQRFEEERAKAKEQEPQAQKLMSAIIHMANDLGKDTIAEGVEIEEQFQWLKEAGCQKIQGYLFHRPMPRDEAEAYIKEKQWLNVKGVKE